MLVVIARALRRAWLGVRLVGGWIGQKLAPPAPRDWIERLTRDREWGPKVEGELRRLAAAWRESFCGACAAGPDYPQGRCPACLRKLADILEPQGSITPSAKLLP